MRLLNRDLQKDGSGFVTLLPEEPEDMWHTYNLIAVGDQVRATTLRWVLIIITLLLLGILQKIILPFFVENIGRRIQMSSNTGSTKSERIRMTLTINVEKMEFEPEAGVLRLKGTNISESEHVKVRQPLAQTLLSLPLPKKKDKMPFLTSILRWVHTIL